VFSFLSNQAPLCHPKTKFYNKALKELTILQSLGLPGLNGKRKQQQVPKLVLHNSEGKHWDIIFPNKVNSFDLFG
jgi:hypothetical protein